MTFAIGRIVAVALLLLPLVGCLDGADAPTDDAVADPPGDLDAPSLLPPWPDLGAATIRPGTRIVADDANGAEDAVLGELLDDHHKCTSNFLFRSPDNRTLYLGTAAHCVTGRTVDDCTGEVSGLQVGDPVAIQGADAPGTLAYSSWRTMSDQADATDALACRSNDFALVAINATDRATVHPATIHWGGPTAAAQDAAEGDTVLTYGQSPYRVGTDELDPRQGIVYDTTPWNIHFSPGTSLPGDSGGLLLTGDGRALGVVVEARPYCPYPLVDDCSKPGAALSTAVPLADALAYLHEHTDLRVELVTWEQLQGPVEG